MWWIFRQICVEENGYNSHDDTSIKPHSDIQVFSENALVAEKLCAVSLRNKNLLKTVLKKKVAGLDFL